MTGLNNRFKKFDKGITLLEALVSTAIIGIGFVAIFQMVQYSVRSIDISGERTKANLLISMVAEDLISERNSSSPSRTKGKDTLITYLVDTAKNNQLAWNAPLCSGGSSSQNTKKNTLDAKKFKWDKRFSKRRIKCKGPENNKNLKIFEICNNSASGNNCKYNNNKNYTGSGIYEKWIVGRMEVNVSTGRVERKGNNVEKKPKKKVLYFQIQ